ncbi:MAG: F0F1 ATP synthase subunit gamma, partial [Rhodospirillaceae bacterium]|nr:F0F1 ATP synthase subunit gamma [Rhodospirillaceae bacterium]
MANLKDLRIRITSVKSTQKITAAMKMVAASKLRRAQVAAEEGRPYAERMERMLGQVTATMPEGSGGPKLLSGTGADDVHLLVVVTADRGLCGGFNSSIVRAARLKVLELQAAGKTVKLMCVGRKGRDGLKREFESLLVNTYEDVTRNGAQFDTARDVAAKISDMFESGEFDVCTLYFNTFKSAMSQVLTAQQLIPFTVPEAEDAEDQRDEPQTLYIMEPSESEILEDLLPRNLSVQVFRALLEGYASEQGAR